MYYKLGARKATLSMLLLAIRLDPFRFRNYQDLLIALFLFMRADSIPDWEFLPSLVNPYREYKD
jgi:hypothetical protein